MVHSVEDLAACAVFVGVVALACDPPAGVPPSGTPSGPTASAPAPASAGAVASVPPATTAPGSAASVPSAGPSALPAFLVGRYSGSATVYADVRDGRQTYTQRNVTIEIATDGKLAMTLDRGPKGQPPTYRCAARGMVTPDGSAVRLDIAESTCAPVKVGATVRLEVKEVGACSLEWKRQRGTTPFEVEQLMVRRDGCK